MPPPELLHAAPPPQLLHCCAPSQPGMPPSDQPPHADAPDRSPCAGAAPTSRPDADAVRQRLDKEIEPTRSALLPYNLQFSSNPTRAAMMSSVLPCSLVHHRAPWDPVPSGEPLCTAVRSVPRSSSSASGKLRQYQADITRTKSWLWSSPAPQIYHAPSWKPQHTNSTCALETATLRSALLCSFLLVPIELYN